MRINFDKWNYVTEACDYDRLVMTRDLTFNYLELTPKRYTKLMNGIKEYNNALRYMYGFDENGNPYRCRCMHDCCGCISSARIQIEFIEKTIRLIYIVNLNY